MCPSGRKFAATGTRRISSLPRLVDCNARTFCVLRVSADCGIWDVRLRRCGVASAWLAEPKLLRRHEKARLRVAARPYGAASFAWLAEPKLTLGRYVCEGMACRAEAPSQTREGPPPRRCATLRRGILRMARRAEAHASASARVSGWLAEPKLTLRVSARERMACRAEAHASG